MVTEENKTQKEKEISALNETIKNGLNGMEVIEPLLMNRFIIKPTGIYIPPNLFRKFKIFNVGEDIIFTTQFYETIKDVFNPTEFYNITGFEIDYLDPVGDIVKKLFFNVTGSNFETKGDYEKNGLSIIKLRFVVDSKTFKIE